MYLIVVLLCLLFFKKNTFWTIIVSMTQRKKLQYDQFIVAFGLYMGICFTMREIQNITSQQ